MEKALDISYSSSEVAEIKINYPKTQNRFDDFLVTALFEAFDTLSTNQNLKAVILSGQPQVFCAGASRDALENVGSKRVLMKDLELPERIMTFPVPVIAAMQGHAVGGGLVLGICCDLSVASDSSRYGFNFTNMGFTPGMGATILSSQLTGSNFAAELLISGKLYKGRELRERGLFNRVVPASKVAENAFEFAWRMVDKPRYVLEMLKESLNLTRLQELQAARQQENLMHQICFNQPETLNDIKESYLD